MIAAVTTWTRRDIRRHWRGLVALALAIALGLAVAMVAAIGARRTDSAWERFTSQTETGDVIAEVPLADLESGLADLAARPGVADVTAFSYMTLLYEGYEPTGGWRTLSGFAGLAPSFLRTLYRPLIIDGRPADPDRVDEITINEAAATVTGLHPGDHIVVTSLPEAVHQPATVVGIHRGPLDVGLNGGVPQILATPAFGSRWFRPYLATLDPDISTGYTGAVLASVPDAVARAALISGGYGAVDVMGGEITGGLDAQGTAYTVLAMVAGIGVLAAAAQTVSRRVRRGADELPTLAALGLTTAERRAAVAAAPVLAAITGGLLAPVVAAAASPLATTGLQRRVELHRRVVVDVPVFVVGALGAVVLLSAAAWFAASRVDTSSAPHGARPHPSPLTLPGPAGMFGGRVATGWASRSGRTVARAHVIGVTLALTATIAVVVWSASARHVVSTPSSYGQTWDAIVAPADDTDFSDPAGVDSVQERLAANPSVGTTVGRLEAGMTVLTGDAFATEVIEVDRSAGPWWPELIRGRVPAARDEVTIGVGLGRRLGTDVGDNLQIGDRTFTIVGEHIVTQFSNGEFGESIAVSRSDADLDLNLAVPFLIVDLADDVSVAVLEGLAEEGLVVLPSATGRPAPITNLARIGGIDDLLAAVCALLGIASFANGLLLATRARRRDHATMLALGAGRRTVAGSVGWHALVVAGVGLAVAAPAGVLVGQAVWRRTALGVHIAPDLFHAWLVVATASLVAAAVAMLVGLAAAWSATGTSASLRTE